MLWVGRAQACRAAGQRSGVSTALRACLSPFSKTVKPLAPSQVGTKEKVTKSDNVPKVGCEGPRQSRGFAVGRPPDSSPAPAGHRGSRKDSPKRLGPCPVHCPGSSPTSGEGSQLSRLPHALLPTPPPGRPQAPPTSLPQPRPRTDPALPACPRHRPDPGQRPGPTYLPARAGPAPRPG